MLQKHNYQIKVEYLSKRNVFHQLVQLTISS